MTKYIDAERLKAEIERLAETLPEVRSIMEGLISLIDSLQHEQLEVDLEKEIDAFFDKWDKNSYGCIFDEKGNRVTIETIKRVVKHFLNAIKEG